MVALFAVVFFGTGCAGMDHYSTTSWSYPSSWNPASGTHTVDTGFREEWNTTDTLRGRGGVVLESVESRGKVGRDERTGFIRNADGSTTVVQAGREVTVTDGNVGTWVPSRIRYGRGRVYR